LPPERRASDVRPLQAARCSPPPKFRARVWTETYNLTYAFTGLRTNTPSAIPPVNVVSPEPRRSPSRGSLYARSAAPFPTGGRRKERIRHTKSPARAGLSKQGVGIVSPTYPDSADESVVIGTLPNGGQHRTDPRAAGFGRDSGVWRLDTG